jgi:hypothetical protein
MEPSTNQPPAGWYADPAGRHHYRYFDGSWTDRVSDNGRIATDPIRRRRRGPMLGALAAGVVVVVVVIAVVASQSSGGDGEAGSTGDVTGDFCADFPANYGPIDAAWATATTISHDLEATADRTHDADQLARGTALLRQLAEEAPNTTDSFGDPLRRVVGNWADFFSAAEDFAKTDDPGDVQRHQRLLDAVQAHTTESTPSLLKTMMFPDSGTALQRCG